MLADGTAAFDILLGDPARLRECKGGPLARRSAAQVALHAL